MNQNQTSSNDVFGAERKSSVRPLAFLRPAKDETDEDFVQRVCEIVDQALRGPDAGAEETTTRSIPDPAGRHLRLIADADQP